MSAIERRQRVTDFDGELVLLEITSPAFTAPMRIVNDTTAWTSGGVEYLPYPFGFTLPDDKSGESPRTQLIIDNVGQGLTEELERVLPNQTVMAKLMLTSRENPDVIDRSFFLPLSSVSVTTATATASAGVDFLMRQQAVSLRFNPFTTPNIF